MGRQVVATSAVSRQWRLADDAGEAIEHSEDGNLKLVEPELNAYVTPPHNVKARLRLSGLSEEFELPSQFGGTTTNIRPEFLILKGSGNAGQAVQGKRFTILCTPKVSKKSNFGALLSRFLGREIEPGESIDIDAFIGTEFVTTLALNERGYAEVDPKFIDSVTLSPLMNGSAANGAVAQEQTPQSDDSAESDPFEEADDL